MKKIADEPSISVTMDGFNQGYTYKEIIKDLTEKYLTNNFTKTIDGIDLETQLVQGSVFKVKYTVYFHNITEEEVVQKYTLHSKQFENVQAATGFVNNMKKTQYKKQKKGGSKRKIVHVHYDTNAVKLYKRKAKVFGTVVPFFGSIESLARSVQKRFGSKFVRVTWLTRTI